MRAAWLVLALGAPPDLPEVGGSVDATDATDATDANAPDAPDAPDASDAKTRAKQAFKRGVELATAGSYAEAAAAFAESDAAFPSPNAAYNAAYAHEKAEAWVAATWAYRDYLGRHADGEWSEEVARALGRLSSKVADLDVRVRGRAADVAVIWVDGAAAGEGSLPSIRLPGPVRIEVRDPDGKVLETRALDLYPGSANTITIELVAATPMGDGDQTPPGDGDGDLGDGDGDVTPPERGPRRWLAGVAIGGSALTVGAGIGVAVGGAQTVQARQAFYDARCDAVCEEGSYPFDEERRFERTRTATNVLVGVTAALGVATVGFAVAAAVDRKRARAATARVRITFRGVEF